MGTRTLRVLVVSALSLFAEGAWAGTIVAELDRHEAALGEAVHLEVRVEGNWDGELEPPQIPGVRIHELQHKTAGQITNGRRIMHMSVVYALFPEAPGTYVVPSISLTVDGEAAATVPLEFVVREAGASGTQPAPQAQSPAAGKAAPRLAPPAEIPGRAETTAGVFVERDCGTKEPYVGEMIVCRSALFHPGNYQPDQRVSESTTDFRLFPVDGNPSRLVLIGNRRYAMMEFQEVVVPTKAGSLALPPFGLRGRAVTMKKRRLGGGVFNFNLDVAEETELVVKSPELTIVAKPLPEAGKPANFQGLVGSFQLSAAANKTQVAAGDTVTITIRLEGEGILDSIAQPSLELDKLGKVYTDKPDYQERVDGQRGVVSARTFKIALVPAAAGSFPLGRVEIPVFDPRQETYVTLTADLGTLEVAPGAAAQTPVVVGSTTGAPAREGVKELERDVLGPHPLEQLGGRGDLDVASAAAAGAVGGLPLLAALGLFAARTVRERQGRDVAGARRSQAYKRFKTTLGTAQAAVGEGKVEGGVSEAHKALRVYLGDVLNRHGEAFTARDVQTEMEKLGLPEPRRAAALQLVERFEQAAFGGRAPDGTVARQWLAELDQLVKEVDAAC